MSKSQVVTDQGLITLAERVLGLLDEGQFTATYKFAVLLGIIDLCLENTTKLGAPPDTLYTGQLATKIIELYWPHCATFAAGKTDIVLKQNTGGQAAIISAIVAFRKHPSHDASATMSRARINHKKAFEKLRHDVEWTLIKMPLPKLQRAGNQMRPFLYRIAWDDNVVRAPVRKYQRDDKTAFDSRIVLEPGVGGGLVALNGLLRPLIHRQWAAKVAQLNKLEESRLEAFLFGVNRISLEPVRDGLREIQANACFYCHNPIRGTPEVDHFIPWSRYPDNSIHNLVLADRSCNNSKRDHLVAPDLVSKWCERNDSIGAVGNDLERLATNVSWEFAPDRATNVARGIYRGLPDEALVWLNRQAFVTLDRSAVLRAFAAG